MKFLCSLRVSGALCLLFFLAGCYPTVGIAPNEERRPVATPTSRVNTPARPSRKVGDDRPESYVVQKGDTLFAIALDFGFDYKELAAWNSIENPSRIQAGQKLRLTPPVASVATTSTTTSRTEPSVTPAAAGTTSSDAPVEVKPINTKEAVSTEPLPADAPAASVEAGTDAPSARTAPATTAAATSEPAPTSTAQAPVFDEPKAMVVAYTDKAWSQLSGVPERDLVAKPDPNFPPPRTEPRSAAKEPTETKPAVRETTTRPAVATPSVSGANSIPPLVTPSTTPTPMGDDRVEWMWPAKGDLVYRFGESGRLKGVGIGGKPGQPVVAAAPGRVVYSGSGLRGYGKLVIIKHGDAYLSVYAHNRDIVVKEGDQVRRGQKIAEMGSTGATNVGVHFEIRRFGKPLDPLSQLPG